MVDTLIKTVYYAALLLSVIFSLVQFSLLLVYLFNKSAKKRPALAPIPWEKLPRLTIQLPIYNELYVVERLIDTVANLQYPSDKLDIQVLDDSTDETTELIARKVAYHQRLGLPITHVRRPERTGFKAGALKYGLDFAKGEFVAIFDADFIPEPDFLLRVLPNFSSPDIGIVQTRWLHLNEEYSLLTRMQAMGLNAHFIVEQNARYSGGFFLNFNGTGGIWRKKTIEDAGGWHSDTLTEDLDLSYRAQLKGWKIVYRDDIGVPGELPVTMNAIKSQQYRWMKGPAECARKHLGRVLSRPEVSLGRKIQAAFHLTNSSLFVILLTMALLTVPLLYLGYQPAQGVATLILANLFSMASVISLIYWGAPFLRTQREQYAASGKTGTGGLIGRYLRFVWMYPLFLAVMLGLSLHNSIAVLEGLFGRKTPFVRTPKFNLSTNVNAWETNQYVKQPFPWFVLAEIGMAIYFGIGLTIGLIQHNYAMLSLHILLTVGFSIVAYYSLNHAWGIRQATTELEPVLAE